jgi:hypothetical protein
MGHARINPDEKLRKELRDRSREVAGFELYDVRWDGFRTLYHEGEKIETEGHDCLCIMEQHVVTGNWVARKPLRHPATDPKATKPYEYEQPDGSVWTTDIPLEPEDEDYEEKVLGLPRQITQEDVDEAIDSARNAYQRSMEIAEELKKQKESALAEKYRIREDYTREAAKELARIMWQERTGKNPFVDLGHHSEAGTGSTEGFKVTDRRRVKDED